MPRVHLRTALALGFVAVGLVSAAIGAPTALGACRGSPFTTTFEGSLGFADFRREVFVRTADGSVAPVTADGVSYEPSISGDGRTLAYLRGRRQISAEAPVPPDQVLVRPLTGRDRRSRLLALAAAIDGTDLSPDGRVVALSATTRPTPPDRPREPPPPPRSPGLITDSVEDNRLALQGPPSRIWLLDTRTAAVVRTVPAPAGALREIQLHPTFSPDGRWLAYESYVWFVDDVRRVASHSVRVARLDADGPGRSVLSLGATSVASMGWAPASDVLTVTRSVQDFGVYVDRTAVLGTDGRLLREVATPNGQEVLPADDGARELLEPGADVPVPGADEFDIADCALRGR